MLGRVVAVPSVSLGVIARSDILYDVIRDNILASELCPAFAGTLEAVRLLVCDGPAILACTLAVLFCRGAGFCASVIPVVELVCRAVILRDPLVAEGRCACIEIPWCLRDVLCAYQSEGKLAEYKRRDVRGMWGLMIFPSSSTAAGAVPALRAASSSFCLRYSSRESFPVAATKRVGGDERVQGQAVRT